MQAGPYAGLLNHDIPVTVVDFHGEAQEKKVDSLRDWIQKALGTAADRYGMRVPKLFATTAARVAGELHKAKRRTLLPFGEWRRFVAHDPPAAEGEGGQVAERLDREQAEAVAT
jgi:hypothetical protein